MEGARQVTTATHVGLQTDNEFLEIYRHGLPPEEFDSLQETLDDLVRDIF